ncbi:MAG: hypothetical protein LQ340_005805 [Diploschistes diacapsis]|nr:MAG: hypothetical protein LQ340_005805 [Diploschistes diacapsis]
MAKRLLNKVAIVTGSSSGLGRAIAQTYSQEGALIACADLRPSARSQVATETETNTDDLIRKEGGCAIFIPTDVTSSSQMQSLVSKTAQAFGRLDIMVNNAGISLESYNPAPIHQTADDVWHRTFAVNTTSVFHGCKHAAAQMLAQPAHASGDRGWIVNISSILGHVGLTRAPAYVASKGAVTQLTKQVALDYAEHRIRCNAICPGFIKTAIFAETTKHVDSALLDEKHPLGGAGTPEDVARMAVVLASDDARWMTGANVLVDGGYTAQ